VTLLRCLFRSFDHFLNKVVHCLTTSFKISFANMLS
jgi:hypothetical protein